MRTTLFALASGLSLILSIGILTLWVRSNDHAETVHRQSGSSWSELTSAGGRVWWVRADGVVVQHEPKSLSNWAVANQPRKLPDDWATHYLPDGKFVQFPGDGRLVTSETSLLPIVQNFVWRRPRRLIGGIVDARGTAYRRLKFDVVAVPYWLVLLLCSAPLLALCFRIGRWWSVRQRDFIRRSRHQCIHCGYFLFASVERCPECGKPVAQGGGRP